MSPPTNIVDVGMSLPDAMRKIIDGKMVKRMSWASKELSYCLLKDGWLMVYINGDFHKWTLNDGDLLANDWIVIEQQN